MKLINGKEPKQFLAELLVPFSETLVEYQDGNPYVGIDYYKKRLYDVASPLNYNINVTNSVFVNETLKPFVKVDVSLDIFYDDGSLFRHSERPGHRNVILLTSEDNSNIATRRPKNIPNDFKSAAADGLKWILHDMGLTFIEPKSKPQSQNKKHNQEEKFTVSIVKGFSSMSKGGYSAVVNMDGEELPLLIWKDKVSVIEQFMPIGDFVQFYVPGKKFIFTGTKCEYRGKPQLTLTNVSSSKE